ncbi:hypothetical protein ABH922_002242 [Rhodococcus sp. 27YEA15]
MATSAGPSVGEERLDQVAPVVTTTGVDHTVLVAETAEAEAPVITEAEAPVIAEAEAPVIAEAEAIATEVATIVEVDLRVAAAKVDSSLVDVTVTEINVRLNGPTNPICPTT